MRRVFNLFLGLSLSLPPSKTSFVDGGIERIIIIRLTSRFVDMVVKRLRNFERKERRIGRVTRTPYIMNQVYNVTRFGKSQHKTGNK